MLICPECNGTKLVKYGWKFVYDKVANKRVKKQQYQCKNCGRITRIPITRD